MQCSSCAFEVAADFAFCPRCGQKLAVACPSCGFACPPEFAFCPKCGIRIAPAAPAPAAVVPSPGPAPSPPAAASAPAHPPVAGERRVVTILFADVSGFTAMSERLDHEQVNQIMRACWAELDQAVLDSGGVVDKHIGDALMATFGAITAHEDDPLRAVRTGLELQRRLLAFSVRLEAAISVTLRMRCGIATGEVTVDHVADSTLELSVIGGPVNLASRLEHECNVGSVFVSRDVYRATEWAIAYTAIEPRPIKGIAGLVPIFEAVDERDARDRRPDRPTITATHDLIGRREEQQRLRDALAAVSAGQGRVVALIGEAGMGKSALAAWFRQQADAAGCGWASGRCLSYTAADAYTPFREILRDLLALTGRDPAGRVRERLEAALDVAGGATGEDAGAASESRAALTRSDRAALLAHLLLRAPAGDGQHADAFVSALEPRTRRRLTVQAVCDFLLAQARQQPLAIMLEDLHWCDDESLEVAATLASQMHTAPLLLLVQTRPDVQPAWATGDDALTLWLHPLSREQSLTLVDAVLHVAAGAGAEAVAGQPGGATATLGPRLHEVTQGNPYFLIELVQDLVEQGRMAPGEGGWQFNETGAAFQLPATVRRLLNARMDTLDRAARQVLEEAAVIGHTFAEPLLERISDQPPAVSPSLSDLTQRQFLHTAAGSLGDAAPALAVPWAGSAGSQRWFEFRHHVLREAAYETLAQHRRRQYHGRIATALEGQLATVHDPGMVDLLAYHYTESDQDERAVHYALLSAERAAAQYANTESLHWFDRAAAALEQRARGGTLASLLAATGAPNAAGADIAGQWVRLLEGRAAVEVMLGQFEVARGHLEDALARCETGPAAPRLAGKMPDLCRRLARVHETQGAFDQAFAWVERGLEHAGVRWEEGGATLAGAGAGHAPTDASQVARLCLIAGLVLMRRARYADAGLWAQRALALAESSLSGGAGDIAAAQDLAQTWNLMGLLARYQGNARDAVAFARESAVRYEAIGDIAGREKALGNAALALQDLGDFAGALVLYRQSEELARRIGDPVRQAAAATNMGEAYLALGEYGQARDGFSRAFAVFEQYGQANAAAVCTMNLANVLVRMGDGAAALARGDEARDRFQRIGAQSYLPEVARHRALALLLLDRPDDARAAAEEAVDLARTLQRRLEEGQTLRVLAQVRAAAGTDGMVAAAAQFAQSRAILEEVRARYELGLTLLEHARALMMEAGRQPEGERRRTLRSEAAALCHEAITLFEAAGTVRMLAEAQALLAETDG